MIFFTVPSYPGTFWLLLAYLESAPIFFNNLWRLHRDSFPTMGRRDIISEPKENKMLLKILACPTGKYHLCVFSLCAKWVKFCPYSVNIGTTWKNLRSFVLSWIGCKERKNHLTLVSPFKSGVSGPNSVGPVVRIQIGNPDLDPGRQK